MADFEELVELPDDFSGIVRLFPLPNLVMFPHVMQPLHIFEERYRRLLKDALQDDRLIAMALLQPGWEESYEGNPPIESVACLGRIASHWPQQDGRSNILLVGLRRVAISRELPPTRPYRQAEIQVLEDVYPSHGAVKRPQLRRRLLEKFRRYIPDTATAQEQFDQLVNHQIPLGMLTDIMAFTLSLKPPAKLALLAESNVDRRAERLLQQLAGEPAEGIRRPPFPPDFSDN